MKHLINIIKLGIISIKRELSKTDFTGGYYENHKKNRQISCRNLFQHTDDSTADSSESR